LKIAPVASGMSGNSDYPENGVEAILAEAIQVYGGCGYCQEYPVEQYARDVKVFSVYEGANGIQSLDLVICKLLMNKDMRNFTVFKNRAAATVAKAKGLVDNRYIALVERGIAKVAELVNMMDSHLMNKRIGQVLAVATPFQQAMHMMVLAWLHLESLTISVPRAGDRRNRPVDGKTVPGVSPPDARRHSH